MLTLMYLLCHHNDLDPRVPHIPTPELTLHVPTFFNSMWRAVWQLSTFLLDGILWSPAAKLDRSNRADSPGGLIKLLGGFHSCMLESVSEVPNRKSF